MQLIHRLILSTAILLAAMLLFGGCATQRCVPETIVERHDSIVNHYLTDSVRVIEKDSVFVKEKGDTIWLTRYKTIVKEHISNKTDTIYQDRVRDVVQTQTIEVVPQYYRWCSWLLWLLVALVAVRISWWAVKKFYLYK